MVAQAGGGALGAGARERGQPAARGRAGPSERLVGQERGQRGAHERRRDAPRGQLGAQARRPDAARRARLDPVAREGGVVDVAPAREVGDDLGGDRARRTAPDQARGELRDRPGAPGQEVGRREAGAPGVEDAGGPRPARYDRRKKELPVAPITGFSSAFCSNVCSPAEKIPRTLRSKSSAFVAASRAVS